MKRSYILNGLFALLVLGLGWATAANINRSVQLSQDPSGPIGFDTQNSIYLPRHLNNSSGPPTISSFGTGAAITGSDMGGEVILGTTPGATATITWRTAYVATPYCTGNTTTATAIGLVPTPNGMTVLSNAVAGAKLYYICVGGNLG